MVAGPGTFVATVIKDVENAGSEIVQVENLFKGIWKHHRNILIVTCVVLVWQILIYGIAASNELPGTETVTFRVYAGCTQRVSFNASEIPTGKSICSDAELILLQTADSDLAPYYLLLWSAPTLAFFVFALIYSVITTVMVSLRKENISAKVWTSAHTWRVVATEIFKYQTLALFLIAFILQLIKWESHGLVDMPYWAIAIFPALSLLITAGITMQQAITDPTPSREVAK